jgi:plasmid stabilization system protein ParE
MTYHLQILPRAEADVEHIYRWIEERSPEGAWNWYSAFEEAARALLINPLGYSMAQENDFVDYELRQFLFKTRHGRIYRGVYVVVDDAVRILRVRGPGQRDLQPDELTNNEQ